MLLLLLAFKVGRAVSAHLSVMLGYVSVLAVTASWSARVYAEKKASYLRSRWKETHGESRTSADKALPT